MDPLGELDLIVSGADSVFGEAGPSLSLCPGTSQQAAASNMGSGHTAGSGPGWGLELHEERFCFPVSFPKMDPWALEAAPVLGHLPLGVLSSAGPLWGLAWQPRKLFPLIAIHLGSPQVMKSPVPHSASPAAALLPEAGLLGLRWPVTL